MIGRATAAVIAAMVAVTAAVAGASWVTSNAEQVPTPTVTVLRNVAGPTVTATVTATATVRATRTVEVSRSRRDSGVDEFLRCVIAHESGGNPRAQNPSSTASGLFQFIRSSWLAYSKAAGVSGYGEAKEAPAEVQWRVARYVVENFGHYPWKGTGCGHGT